MTLKRTKRTAKKEAAKPPKKKTPCKHCAGFMVPARSVKSVARNSKGRFVKAG